jgi:hypothetical protein
MPKSKSLPSLEYFQERFYVDASGRLLCKQKACRYTTRKPGDEAGSVNSTGYRVVVVDRRKYLAHRLVWLLTHGEDPGELEIDHINGDRTDNRPCNLRLCSCAQNVLNSKPSSRNKSGVKGVHFEGACRKRPWRAQYRCKRLGQFATKEEAIKAVADARKACKDKEFHWQEAS